jgi:hypothetical protein
MPVRRKIPRQAVEAAPTSLAVAPRTSSGDLREPSGEPHKIVDRIVRPTKSLPWFLSLIRRDLAKFLWGRQPASEIQFVGEKNEIEIYISAMDAVRCFSFRYAYNNARRRDRIP